MHALNYSDKSDRESNLRITFVECVLIVLLLSQKFYRQMVDALGYRDDEGRSVPAISCGEVVSNL